MNDKVTGD